MDIYYVHTDHLNAPRRVTATNNALRWKWDREPFGTGTVNSNPSGLGTFTYNLRLPGQFFDTETGLNYNYFRDYDPAIGRYVESDPIGLTGGINGYVYAGSSPVGSFDPKGLFYVSGGTGRMGEDDGGGVFCDSRGGLETKLFGDWDECLKDCALEHERSHVADIKARHPSICSGVVGNGRISPSSTEEQRWTERRAYMAELRCLNSKVNDCVDCEETIRARMIFVRLQIQANFERLR